MKNCKSTEKLTVTFNEKQYCEERKQLQKNEDFDALSINMKITKTFSISKQFQTGPKEMKSE